jgi:hypothetical protein
LTIPPPIYDRRFIGFLNVSFIVVILTNRWIFLFKSDKRRVAHMADFWVDLKLSDFGNI